MNWKIFNGIALSTGIGIISLYLAQFTPTSINSILLALAFGMLIGNLVKIPASFESGVALSSSRLLELSILFLAFAINYKNIIKLGPSLFIGVAIILFLGIGLTVFLSKKLKFAGASAWLIGFGTAICGSSAIAALAPSTTKDREDVAVSMAVVNLYGALGMLFLPIILLFNQVNATDTGLIIGGSLHSVGNVAGAAFTVGPEAGEVALTVKLARVALLTPGLIFINFLINRKSANSWTDHFKLPWYLVGFVVVTLLGTFITFPTNFLECMELIGKVILTIAMGAIGLKVSFSKLLKSGKNGLLFGALLFGIQLVLYFGLSLI
ncbi:MAG: putative sulfate exporter family transporter [Bacteroidota bacterium]